ncbi:hypothetical protein BH20BAC1_BH20BAC1_00920 [soil metagenome]
MNNYLPQVLFQSHSFEVVNTPNNALVGDAKFHSGNRRYHSNITRLENAWRHPFVEAPLLEAGLIGPVTIEFVKRIE